MTWVRALDGVFSQFSLVMVTEQGCAASGGGVACPVGSPRTSDAH